MLGVVTTTGTIDESRINQAWVDEDVNLDKMASYWEYFSNRAPTIFKPIDKSENIRVQHWAEDRTGLTLFANA